MTALAGHLGIVLERTRLYSTLRESEARYRMVVNNVREIIFQTDMYGIFTFLNPAWSKMTGYTIDETLGDHNFNYIPEEAQEANFIVATQLLQGEKDYHRYQTHYRRKDGSTVPVEIHVQFMKDEDGNPFGIAGTITDISERIRAEKQSLELELKIRTVETLKGFLSGISHDLRTPLSIMNTSLYLLRRKLAEGSAEMRYVNTLNQQVNHLARAVQDMLDISHLDDEMVEFNFIRVNLNGLIRDVLLSMEGAIQAKQHQVAFQPDPNMQFVVVDQVMIGRVVQNLLSNAINYTPAGGTITLRTRFSATEATMEVQDTGIGIEQDELPLIFDRFYKVDKARPAGESGTGLGLSIAKKIIEAHHGTIDVTSTPGQGSTFRVSLPVTST
jgi:PAS domain S-box-containing protein